MLDWLHEWSWAGLRARGSPGRAHQDAGALGGSVGERTAAHSCRRPKTASPVKLGALASGRPRRERAVSTRWSRPQDARGFLLVGPLRLPCPWDQPL
jgi:hypothetical protein